LKDHAEFLTDYSFKLKSKPLDGDYSTGLYELPRRSGEAHLYRLGHPLAIALLNNAKCKKLFRACIEFDLKNYEGKISVLDNIQGYTGSLRIDLLSVQALDQTEEYFLYSCHTTEGQGIDDEAVRRMFSLGGKIIEDGLSADGPGERKLEEIILEKEKTVLKNVSKRNVEYFETEAEKLDGWAEDLKLGLEKEIKEIDRQIRETRKLSVAALSLEEKLKYQKEIKILEGSRNTKRKSLFEAQDDIDRRRGEFIAQIEDKLNISSSRQILFEIDWRIV